MGLPKSVSGDSYTTMWQAMADAAMQSNGLEAVGELPPPLGGSFVGRLSNGEAVALVVAWRHAAARSTVRWPLGVDLAAYALGAKGEGQRFVMTKEHAQAPLSGDGLVALWAATAQLAQDLDASGAVVRTIPINATWAGYEDAARDIWEVIKSERATAQRRPTPEEMEKMLRCAARPWLAECNENTLPDRVARKGSGLVMMLLGVGVVWYVATRKG